MKVQGHVCMEAGENEIFASNLPEQMVGQITKHGWTVIKAEPDGNKVIWLTIEGELEV